MLLESLNPTVCNIIDIYDDDEIHNKTVSIEIISPAGISDERFQGCVFMLYYMTKYDFVNVYESMRDVLT